MRQFVRTFGPIIVVSMLLAACGSPASTSAGHSVRPSAPTSAPAVTASASAPAIPGPLLGTQLAYELDTHVPAGFKLDKKYTDNSGSGYQIEVNGAPLSASHCAELDDNVWMETAGMSGVAYAQSDYIDHQQDEITEEIDAFDTPTDALRTMAQLKAFAHKCLTFRDRAESSSPLHLAVVSEPGLGANAFEEVVTAPDIEGASIDLATIVGDSVVTLSFSDGSLATARTVTRLAAVIDKKLGSISG